jgi:hypothetical protein
MFSNDDASTPPAATPALEQYVGTRYTACVLHSTCSGSISHSALAHIDLCGTLRGDAHPPLHRHKRVRPLTLLCWTDINTRYAHYSTTESNVAMEDPEDIQDLSSLDADDEFERRMIQNARDERRLKDALHSTHRVQAFRKARVGPLGLTIDNLERSNARNDVAIASNANVKVQSPPSSSGSARSDPAIHAPAGWGRKSRTNRNWMRTITHEEPAQTPPPADDTVDGLYDDENHPRRSVEDSPLSHKGTPRNDRSAEWDLTFEINEASIIASTPYIPRNTMLDDIRQREAENLQADEAPESPTPEAHQSRLSLSNNDIKAPEAMQRSTSSLEKRLRHRTNSWQSIGKSQAVTGSGKENSPVTVYKTTTESVSIWEESAVAGTRRGPTRPVRHSRADSQDLLRRLARASNTPSPRPQIAPTVPPGGSSQTMPSETSPTPAEKKEKLAEEERPREDSAQPAAASHQTKSKQNEVDKTRRESHTEIKAAPEKEVDDVDVTPMPSERPVLEAKTPVVTGAWIDTPGPRTIRKHISISRSRSSSPKKGSPRKSKNLEEAAVPTTEEAPKDTTIEVIRPQLPSSALHALVQEAKAQGRRQSADFGDSTIHSLEELVSTPPEGDIDEDTLQGLQLPTTTPRNDAERQRQQELTHLHRMNDRLRAARTSIRDASRGMKRVEDRVEHGEETEGGEQVTIRDCPCAVEGHHSSIWRTPNRLFWDATLRTKRQGTNWRTLGGLTTLSILMLALFLWWISEEIACELYCQHPYATYSPYSFSVNPNAPEFPFVIPTLAYQTLFWWTSSGSPGNWIGGSVFGYKNAVEGVSSTATWAATSQIAEEVVWDQSMLHDEVIR